VSPQAIAENEVVAVIVTADVYLVLLAAQSEPSAALHAAVTPSVR